MIKKISLLVILILTFAVFAFSCIKNPIFATEQAENQIPDYVQNNNNSVPTSENWDYVKYTYEFRNNEWKENGYDVNGVRHIRANGRSFGPYLNLFKGAYKVNIEGQNLQNAKYTLCSNRGKSQIIYATNENNNNENIEFLFDNPIDIKYFEIIIENNSNNEVVLNNLTITPVLGTSLQTDVKLPSNIDKIFFIQDQSEPINYNLISYVIKNNITIKDITSQSELRKYFYLKKENALTYIPRKHAIAYLKDNINFYNIDGNVFASYNKLEGHDKNDNDELWDILPRYSFVFDDKKWIVPTTSKHNLNVIFPKTSSAGGPYMSLNKGTYKLNITGTNLQDANFALCHNKGKSQLLYAKNPDNTSENVELLFTTNKDLRYFEVVIENKSKQEISLDQLTILPVKKSSIETNIKLPDNIKKIFIIRDDSNIVSPDLINYASKNDIQIKDISFYSELLKSIYLKKKNAITYITKSAIMSSIDNKINVYGTNDNIFISYKEFEGMTKLNYFDFLSYNYNFKDNEWKENSYDENGVRHIRTKGRSYGPYINLIKGAYKVNIKGQNLNSAKYKLCYNQGKEEILYAANENNTSENIEFFFSTTKDFKSFEVVIENPEKTEVVIEKLDIIPIDSATIATDVKLPDSIKTVFVIKSEDDKLEYELVNYVAKNNIILKDISKQSELMKYFYMKKKNALTYISKSKAIGYVNGKLNLYNINNMVFASYNKLQGSKKNDNDKLWSSLPKFSYIYVDKKWTNDKQGPNNLNIIFPKMSSNGGPFINLSKGTYQLDVNGKNLQNAKFILYFNKGKSELLYAKNDNNTPEKVGLLFNVPQNIKYFEVVVENKGKQEIVLDKLTVIPIQESNLESSFKLPSDIQKIYVIKNDDDLLNYDLISYVAKNGLTVKDISNQSELIKHFYLKKQNALTLISQNKVIKYIYKNIHIYNINDNIFASLKNYDKLTKINNLEFLNYNYDFQNSSEWKENSYDDNGIRHIRTKGRSFGPYINLVKGTYKINIEGQQLQNAQYRLCFNKGKSEILYAVNENNNSENAELLFNTNKDLKQFEVVIENKGKPELILSRLTISPVNETLTDLKLPSDIKTVFVIKKSDELLNYNVINYIAKNKIVLKDISSSSEFMKYFYMKKKNTITYISKKNALSYIKDKINLYNINDNIFASLTPLAGYKTNDNDSLWEQLPRYSFVFDDKKWIELSMDVEQYINVVYPATASAGGPFINLNKGTYKVNITGQNLNNANFVLYSDRGKSKILYGASENNTPDNVELLFNTPKNLKYFEVAVENNSPYQVKLDGLTISPVKTDSLESDIKLSENIRKIFVIKNETDVLNYNLISYVAKNGLILKDISHQSKLLKSFYLNKQNALTYVSKIKVLSYINEKINLYDINGNIFASNYVLKGYKASNKEDLWSQYSFVFDDKRWVDNIGYHENNLNIMNPQTASLGGPSINLNKGTYKLNITGKNLQEAKFVLYLNHGKSKILYAANQNNTDECIELLFNIPKDIKYFEISVENLGTSPLSLDTLAISPVKTSELTSDLKLPENIKNIYVIKNGEDVLSYDFINYIAKHNINLKDISEETEFIKKFYLKKKNSLTYIVYNKALAYANKNVYFYNIDGKTYISALKLDNLEMNKSTNIYEDLVNNALSFNNPWVINGYDENGQRHLKQYGRSFGPYIELLAGKYTIDIYGTNLSNIDKFYMWFKEKDYEKNGFSKILYKEDEQSSNEHRRLYIDLERNINEFELIIDNPGPTELVLSKITMTKEK
ncbi:hypothetical protein IJ182_07740 [bacterium]|nr:hypothetical protein [bacterium]